MSEAAKKVADYKTILLDQTKIVAFLPMPPQSNHLYGGLDVKRRYPMPKLVAFKKQIETMSLVLRSNLKARFDLQTYQGVPIKLERRFYFHRSSVFSKAGTVKRMDVSNRIKACDDALEILFGIDDSYVFFGSEEKCISQTPEEFVRLEITRIN